MIISYEVVGWVPPDALKQRSADGTLGQRLLFRYRSYLEDAIETKYDVTCLIGFSDDDKTHFRLTGKAAVTLVDEDLVAFERHCRELFLEINPLAPGISPSQAPEPA